jgi:hypothetical protein
VGRLAGTFLLCCAAATVSADDAEERARGPAALPGLLTRIDDKDPDVRLRVRHVARQIVLDYYRVRTPRGYALVPGEIVLGTRRVRVEKGAYLAVHEVTVGEWLAFARARKLPAARWRDVPPELPVVNIDWTQARRYAEWKGARLPTSAELRRAATCAGRAPYPWGRRFEPHRLNSREGGLDAPLAPGSRPEGRSPHGLQDLLGNVAEWTTSQPERGGRYFVVGGSFLRRADGVIRSGRFTSYTMRPSEWRRDVGMRLARSLPPLVIPPPDAEPEREHAPPESGN